MDVNLWGMVLQAIGLGLAAIRDLAKRRAESAHGEIRQSLYAEIFDAAKNGVEYEESTQEKVSRDLTTLAQKFDSLLPYSIAIAATGTLMQIAAEVSK